MKTLKLLIIFALSLNPGLASGDAGAAASGKTKALPAQLVGLKPPPSNPTDPTITACISAINAYNATDVNACNGASDTADNFCMAGSSPSIHKGILVVGGLLAGVAMMKSMQDSCNKFNDAMKAGQLALTAYNTSCTVVQGRCDTACGAAVTALQAVEKACATSPPVDFVVEQASAQKMAGVCKGYTTSMMVAGAGIMSMLQQSGLMGKCDKAVAAVDCTKDPMNTQCPQAMDCSKPENASNAVCICKANPGAAGCGGTYAGGNSGTPGGNGGRPTLLDDQSNTDIGNYTGGGTDGLISPTGAGANAGGSSLAGGGGGGGGGGGLGGGSGGGKEKEGGKKSGLNANILGGYEGGGGGGGRGMGSAANSGFKDYMPGGKNDPSRNVAAQGLPNREVTASGSKSNWEKVSDRYSENRRTLMGP